MFALNTVNRALDWDHVERLTDSIQAKNLLEDFPILVDTNMVVIDGQHRLMAAEALDVPIFYKVSMLATVDDVARVNADTKRWTAYDYMDRYVKEGRPEYLKLAKFMDEFVALNIPISVAIPLCNYGTTTSLARSFNTGNYQCNDIPFARTVLHAVIDFGQYLKFYLDRRFISTVATLMANADYNHRRMMKRMEYASSKIVKCPDRQAYYDKFNEVYNYRVREENYVHLRILNASDPKHRVDRKKAIA